MIECICILQITEEVSKLLELKAQLGDGPAQKFILKTPKVNC